MQLPLLQVSAPLQTLLSSQSALVVQPPIETVAIAGVADKFIASTLMSLLRMKGEKIEYTEYMYTYVFHEK